MATGTYPLPIGGATPPDGSSSNAAPAIQRVKSSAGAPTPYFLQAAFDASTIEILNWSFRMPADYASALVMKVPYKMASATSGGVAISVYVDAVTPGDAQDVDADGFSTINTATDATVPGTAGYLDEISVTVTNADSVAAGDTCVVRLQREVADAADTATGDMEVRDCALQYTTT
jgi:hypothetical protein